MPQEKGPGQPPSTRGKSPTPPAPSKPDPKRVYAPPSPEPPEAGYRPDPGQAPPRGKRPYAAPPSPEPSGYGDQPGQSLPGEPGYATPPPRGKRPYAPPPPTGPSGYEPEPGEEPGYEPAPPPPAPPAYGGKGGYGDEPPPEETSDYGTGEEPTGDEDDYDPSEAEEPDDGYGSPPPPPDETGYGPPDDGEGEEPDSDACADTAEDDGEAAENEDRLRRLVADAQARLKAAEAELAKHQQRAKLLETIGDIVDDYEKNYPGLLAAQDRLYAYQQAEETCLTQILGPDCIERIPCIAEKYRNAIKRLEGQIKAQESELAKRRLKLEAAKRHAAGTKAEFDELMKPVASIGARLKAVETYRAEVSKAHNAGDYAVAYWLLTDPEKLDGKLNGKPEIVQPDELEATIVKAWKAMANAAHHVEALEAEIKSREQTLKADYAELALQKKELDERIIRRLSELEPHHAEAA